MKVFPCGVVGGPKYLRTLKEPFPRIDFLPTGGINLKIAPDYIWAGATAVGVGEGILDVDALRTGNIDVIAANGRKYVDAIQSARMAMGQPRP